MATAFKLNPSEDRPALVKSGAAVRIRNDRIPVRRDAPQVSPDRYIVREISFLMDSDGLQFLYKDSTPAKSLPDRKIEPVLPRFKLPVPAAIGLTGAGLATAETPLDLSVTGGPAYLIFKLDPRLNWRFSSQEPAITHKRAEHAEYYGGLFHVGDDFASFEPVPDCRLVYFVANPPEGEYQHGFNINVELIQKPHVGETEPRILPIMIDPDIRFPGGSLS